MASERPIDPPTAGLPARLRVLLVHAVAIALGLAFAWIGLLHFRNPEPFEAIVPTYLGWPRFWNFASGGLEIVLGLEIISRDSYA